MRKNIHTPNDARPFLFQFLYGDGLKIDPSLNSEERKKYVKERIKKVWLYNGIVFLIGAFYAGIRLNVRIEYGEPSDIIIPIFFVSLFIVLSLLDCIKLLIRNRKIDKMQKTTDRLYKLKQ